MMFDRNVVDPYLSKLTTDDDKRVVIYLYRKMVVEGKKADYFALLHRKSSRRPRRVAAEAFG